MWIDLAIGSIRNISDCSPYSAGFDASPHEHSYMSRHGRNVPTTFYKQFALDVRDFADQYADGRILSVLEGGYSNRALISGVGSLMEGLGGENRDLSDWWDVIRLEKVRLSRSCLGNSVR